MTSRLRPALLIALIAFCAGLAGAWLGRTLVPAAAAPVELHDVLHHQLDLDAGQLAQVERLEAGFAGRKAVLEAQLRANNAELAAAIASEHGEGPAVTAAVDRSHHAMGELQKATLAHVFAMRALLRPDQAVRFDAAVTRALTATDR